MCRAYKMNYLSDMITICRHQEGAFETTTQVNLDPRSLLHRSNLTTPSGSKMAFFIVNFSNFDLGP